MYILTGLTLVLAAALPVLATPTQPALAHSTGGSVYLPIHHGADLRRRHHARDEIPKVDTGNAGANPETVDIIAGLKSVQ